jgi:hypothetical protein
MGMRRYLLVLDMDLLAMDEEHDLEPINQLVKAVRAETRRHDYDEVILATGRHEGSKLAYVVGRDPVQRLRRQWGQRLIVFPKGPPQS